MGLIGLALAATLTTNVAYATETATDETPGTATTQASAIVTAGDLTIQSNGSVNFEEITLGEEVADTMTFNADPNSNVNITVTDNRGTKQGWEVRARRSAFTINGNEALPNAKINFGTGTALLNGHGKAYGIAPVFNQEGVSVGTTETDVITATNSNGMGQWQINWPNSEINLSLSGSEYLGLSGGTYSTDITWTLYATPDAQ
ncbi:WxL domain-containing protein [Aerococcus agrisoli]|nr:WxL domain-containing protein [Aerococcus agrisoli]